ncbi:MAG: serine hydrolase [Eubacteriales bacterium]|nr:serine hydrolase [Eubacteriales bacterium]
MGKKFLCLIIVGVLIVCGSSSAGYQNLNKTVENISEGFDISSFSIMLTQDGHTVWRAYHGEGTDKNSLFCIGSITKSFVAALTLILEKEGQISLEDKISDYLPELDFWNKKNITLNDLLSMRSGIADYTTGFDAEDYFEEYAVEDLIKTGLSKSYFLKQGEFNYSNTNILIVELMIEKATGRSCEELIKEKILNPLGLDDTYFADEKRSVQNRLVPGYADIISESAVDFTDTTTSWSGLACGMYSNASDMAKWGRYLIKSPMLFDASREKLLASQHVEDGLGYGLCILQRWINGLEVFILRGNVPGYSSAAYIFGDTVLTVLCNLSDYSGKNISYAEEIAEALLPMLY